MSPDLLLPTATLLALFVTLAGLYALFYALGRMRHSHALQILAYANYAAQWGVVIALWEFTPLGLPWKLLMTGTALVSSLIPKLAWHYIQDLHHLPGA